MTSVTPMTPRALNTGADFTALFAIADNMAIGAMRALHETAAASRRTAP